MFDLDGKTILLTGASKGIGAAIAQALGHAGAHLVAHYGSDHAGAEGATAEIPAKRKLIVKADFVDNTEVDALWRTALAWRNRIDRRTLGSNGCGVVGPMRPDALRLRAR